MTDEIDDEQVVCLAYQLIAFASGNVEEAKLLLDAAEHAAKGTPCASLREAWQQHDVDGIMNFLSERQQHEKLAVLGLMRRFVEQVAQPYLESSSSAAAATRSAVSNSARKPNGKPRTFPL